MSAATVIPPPDPAGFQPRPLKKSDLESPLVDDKKERKCPDAPEPTAKLDRRRAGVLIAQRRLIDDQKRTITMLSADLNHAIGLIKNTTQRNQTKMATALACAEHHSCRHVPCLIAVDGLPVVYYICVPCALGMDL